MPVAKKKCKQCKEFEYAEKGVKVPAGFFCSMDHLLLFVQDKRDKDRERQKRKAKQSQAKKDKADRAHLRARKEAIKPASKFLSEAQAIFNKYIRIRDLEDPCISCGKPRQQIENEQGWKVGGCWDAGHFKTRGAKGQLRFILFNVHKQCKSCNGGGGRFSAKAATVDKQYRENLINKIGIEKVEWLENNNDLDLVKSDIEYLKRVKKIFSKKYRLYLKKFRGE